MFFRRSKREKADRPEAGSEEPPVLAAEAVEDLSEAPVAPQPDPAFEAQAAYDEGAAEIEDHLPATTGDEMIRLFPGFEREDFEVGYASSPTPSLLMRWKDGGDWFPLPPMFNRAVLSAMDERDSAGDLGRLMRNFGYDIDAE